VCDDENRPVAPPRPRHVLLLHGSPLDQGVRLLRTIVRIVEHDGCGRRGLLPETASGTAPIGTSPGEPTAEVPDLRAVSQLRSLREDSMALLD